MDASRAIFVVFLCALTVVIAEKLHPLSDEFINLINSKQNSWKAGRNFPVDTPLSYIKNLMGALKNENFPELPKMKHDAELIASLPESFDPRDKWPNCLSLSEIRDQGACGSCWAIAAVETMTDRYCTYSNGTKKFHFSVQDLLTCSRNTGVGCRGGDPYAAWEYWRDEGIVSGGNYNSGQGCRPYEIAACEHANTTGNLPPCGDPVPTPECVKSCISSYDTDYDKDLRHGKTVYRVSSDEEDIKAELFMNGPLEVAFDVYFDFLHYKQGIYKHTSESDKLGGHAVKMLGWGVEDDVKYWLIANSWNPDWGDNGYFKILRGTDHCGIEGYVVGGEPLIE